MPTQAQDDVHLTGPHAVLPSWFAVTTAVQSVQAAAALAARSVWTPATEALWLRAHALREGEIHAHAQHHFLSMKRADGKTEPTLDQVAAFLRLGHALMQTTQAVAGPRAPAESHSRGG